MSKVVLITGGSSGIGKSIGEFLLQKGFVVIGTSRNPDTYINSKFPLVTLDVRDNTSIVNAINQIVKTYKRLDVLINNAGVGITGPIEEIPEDEIKNNFETNFFGPLNVIKVVLPQMRQQNNGLVINITSIAGFMGLPYRGVYSASKSAFSIITEAFRMELKDFNIKMCNVAPGDFVTNIAAGRFHKQATKNSPYKKYQQVLKNINDHVTQGSNPNIVAHVILKVIETKNPKVNYRVGTFMQKFSITLKNVLPSKVYEKMLLKHYKL